MERKKILESSFFTFLLLWGVNVFAAETIKIGVSCPMTGGSADMGISMRNGVRLAVNEINGWNGGVLGKKIELIERDDLADNETGKKIAEELVSKEKVSATIGICNAGVGQASLDTYQKGKVPLMIAVSAGTPLAQKFSEHASDFYIFRTSPRDEIQAKFIVSEVVKQGAKNIALLADTSAYGNSGVDYVVKELAARNMKLSTTQRFAVGQKDMTDQVSQAKAVGSDVIIIWTVGPEAAEIAKSIAKLKWPVRMIGSWPMSWRNFVEPSGDAAEGAQMVVSFIQQASTPVRNSFLMAYQREFNVTNIPAPMASAQGYDAMRILQSAILQAKSTEPSKIKEALESLDNPVAGVITTYTKPYSKADHDALTYNMLVLGVVRKGQIQYAYEKDEMKSFITQEKSK